MHDDATGDSLDRPLAAEPGMAAPQVVTDKATAPALATDSVIHALLLLYMVKELAKDLASRSWFSVLLDVFLLAAMGWVLYRQRRPRGA